MTISSLRQPLLLGAITKLLSHTSSLSQVKTQGGARLDVAADGYAGSRFQRAFLTLGFPTHSLIESAIPIAVLLPETGEYQEWGTWSEETGGRTYNLHPLILLHMWPRSLEHHLYTQATSITHHHQDIPTTQFHHGLVRCQPSSTLLCTSIMCIRGAQFLMGHAGRQPRQPLTDLEWLWTVALNGTCRETARGNHWLISSDSGHWTAMGHTGRQPEATIDWSSDCGHWPSMGHAGRQPEATIDWSRVIVDTGPQWGMQEDSQRQPLTDLEWLWTLALNGHAGRQPEAVIDWSRVLWPLALNGACRETAWGNHWLISSDCGHWPSMGHAGRQPEATIDWSRVIVATGPH